MQAHFELAVVTSRDGFIARYSGDRVSDWSSPEEQSRFRQCFEGIDWGIMGRVSHEQVYKPDRRRIVVSRSAPVPQWREPNHLWADPALTPLEAMIEKAATRHPARRNLILGGTAVHDWFLELGRIDRIQLAIEPVTFGTGLPIFSDPRAKDPLAFLKNAGFHERSAEKLNGKGSYWYVLERSQA